ncbi:MAG: hypothetical protein JSU72_05500 [Deltaproteobacteria bacterium]|nr:MAG: hypothetical protein JSU72_05500 [Deltaproteobacteria bacterium]
MGLKQKKLAYYITPHGFGHAVRSLEVIRNLLEQAPGLEIRLVSSIPDFLVRHALGKPMPMRKKPLDIGLVQRDSLQFDLEASRQAVASLYQNRRALLAEETRFLKTQRISAVICDIPFLPLSAASQCGIPSIGIGNFTWDWVYQAYVSSDPEWAPLVDWIRESYQKCDLFLQLPMHGDCSACPNIQQVPLVARRAKKGREETRRILGLRSDQEVYLVSFAALDLNTKAQNRIQDIADRVFLFKRPLNFPFRNGVCLDQFPLSYEDTVGAVDAVITKPGYGIVADCLAHGTPMIYTDRGDFAEYDVLVREMARQLTTVYLASTDLYAGRWKSAIEKLGRQPRVHPTVTHNGAEVCARIILGFLNG